LEKEIMTTKKETFAIVANIAFALDSILAGAFNAHHKTRLIKLSGNMGKVTEEGAVFFTNRPRLTREDLIKRLPEGYALVFQDTPFEWAINAQGAAVQAGQGIIGQTLFSMALSSLTQAAAKAQAKKAASIKVKPPVTLPSKAPTSPQVTRATRGKAQVKASN
jgi:hypothetical protein